MRIKFILGDPLRQLPENLIHHRFPHRGEGVYAKQRLVFTTIFATIFLVSQITDHLQHCMEKFQVFVVESRCDFILNHFCKQFVIKYKFRFFDFIFRNTVKQANQPSRFLDAKLVDVRNQVVFAVTRLACNQVQIYNVIETFFVFDDLWLNSFDGSWPTDFAGEPFLVNRIGFHKVTEIEIVLQYRKIRIEREIQLGFFQVFFGEITLQGFVVQYGNKLVEIPLANILGRL